MVRSSRNKLSEDIRMSGKPFIVVRIPALGGCAVADLGMAPSRLTEIQASS